MASKRALDKLREDECWTRCLDEAELLVMGLLSPSAWFLAFACVAFSCAVPAFIRAVLGIVFLDIRLHREGGEVWGKVSKMLRK